MFWFGGYFLGIPIWWIMIGAITGDGHRGAVAAAAWGFICLAFLAFYAFIATAGWRSVATKADAFAMTVRLASVPTALMAWGTHSAHGSTAFWTVFWFIVASIVIQLLGKAGVWIKEKTDY